MSDLAREMNVARTTLYRQVDSVDEALMLCAARLVYQFLDEVAAAMLKGTAWTDLFIGAVSKAVELRHDNPLGRRLLEHEPELIGEFIAAGGALLAVKRLGEVGAPLLQTAMAAGQLRKADPTLAAETLARTVMVMLVCPPETDLRATVEFMLAPLISK